MSFLRFTVGFSALFFGFTMEPANAHTSRSGTFLFSCKGQQASVTLKLDGFPNSSSQIVLGGEIALFENKTEGASGRSAIRQEGPAKVHAVRCAGLGAVDVRATRAPSPERSITLAGRSSSIGVIGRALAPPLASWTGSRPANVGPRQALIRQDRAHVAAPSA